MLPLDFWTINTDVMMVRSASEKVSDMKDFSYLNLKETENDESSKQIYAQQEQCMHFFLQTH